MPSYILLLLAASLVVVAVYFFLGKSIPVEPPVYYASVGFSLVLSIALPSFLASRNAFGVVIIYILLILFFSLGLTVVREKLFLKGSDRVPADPENTYVGQKVGLLTAETGADEPTFAEIMARQMVAGVPENTGQEEPFPQQEPPGDAETALIAPETPAPITIGPKDRRGEEPTDPWLLPEVSSPVPAKDPYAGPGNREQPGDVDLNQNAAAAGENREQAAPSREDPAPEADGPPEEGHPEREGRPGGPQPQNRDRYVHELHGLFKALAMRPPLRLKARLTLRLSEVYRDLGQYWQAVEIVRTFLAAGNAPDGEVLNALIVNAAYCQAIQRTLREEGLNSVPYADLTEGIRAGATRLAGRLILQGGWQGEEIAGNH